MLLQMLQAGRQDASVRDWLRKLGGRPAVHLWVAHPPPERLISAQDRLVDHWYAYASHENNNTAILTVKFTLDTV